MKNSVVKIESTTNNSFGTGFIIDKDNNGVYILTCQHIIEDVKQPMVEQVLALIIVEDSFIDMAILYVPKLQQKPLSLQLTSCDSQKVEIIGFSNFNQTMSQKQNILATLFKETIELHSNDDNRHYNVHKIKVDNGFHFNHGNSGSPVICKKSKNIIAMISYKKGSEIGYAIDIKYIQEVWKEIPKDLFEGKSKKQFNTTNIVLKLKPSFNRVRTLLFITLLGIVLYNLFSIEEVNFFNENNKRTYFYKSKKIEITLKDITKEGNIITAIIVVQNNGDKNARIQYRGKGNRLNIIDENGKRWRVKNINSISSSYSGSTIILKDSRRIISEHIFEAVESDKGTDFYMNLEYIINGQAVQFVFDHINL